MREASKLLDEAGWKIDGGKRRNAKGELLEVEILIFDPTFERVLGPYVENLRRLGLEASIRRVDPAQYERRMKSFDFDLTTQRYVMSLTPGVELKNFWIGRRRARTAASTSPASPIR